MFGLEQNSFLNYNGLIIFETDNHLPNNSFLFLQQAIRESRPPPPTKMRLIKRLILHQLGFCLMPTLICSGENFLENLGNIFRFCKLNQTPDADFDPLKNPSLILRTTILNSDPTAAQRQEGCQDARAILMPNNQLALFPLGKQSNQLQGSALEQYLERLKKAGLIISLEAPPVQQAAVQITSSPSDRIEIGTGFINSREMHQIGTPKNTTHLYGFNIYPLNNPNFPSEINFSWLLPHLERFIEILEFMKEQLHPNISLDARAYPWTDEGKQLNIPSGLHVFDFSI